MNYNDCQRKDGIDETAITNNHNTLDDLIQGLQELRNKYGNLRVVIDYDCQYEITPLAIEDFRPLKDDNGKVLGFYIVT
jgi:hypothetical protein